jgi:hypothetical protein
VYLTFPDTSRITFQLHERRIQAKTLDDEDVLTSTENVMSYAEKVELWNPEHSDFRPGSELLDQQLDEIQSPPMYQEIRSFLLHGQAYQWLLANARSAAILTETNGTIQQTVKRTMENILSSMSSSKSRSSSVLQAEFDMDWDLPSFLASQEYDMPLDTALEGAITVTGSSHNAQALRCIDYMYQIWPSTGREIVRVLQKVLRSPDLYCSSK